MSQPRQDDELLGRYRAMERISDSEGLVRVLALDHGASFVHRLTLARGVVPMDAEVLRVKASIAAQLAPSAGGIVLDPQGALEHAIEQRLIPRSCAMIAGLPDVDSATAGSATSFAPQVDRLAELGCDAVKVCLVVEPADDIAPLRGIAADVSKRCSANGLASIVEVVVRSDADARRGTGASMLRGSAELARAFATTGGDALKLAFPAMPAEASADDRVEACISLTESCDGVPWLLLSAGASYELFERQLEEACRGGASGFVAGTAIWQEVLELDSDLARTSFLLSTGATRLARLNTLVTRWAHGPLRRAAGATAHSVRTT